MKFITFILFVIPLFTFGQKDSKIVIGKVISENSKKAIPFVFVKNTSISIFSSCDNKGIFKIQASIGDTLEFTHVSTFDKKIVVNSTIDTLIIHIKDNIEELEEVIVLPGYNKFQKEFLALDIKDDQPKIYIPGVKIRTEPGIPPPVSVANPLSFIASKLSKKEKEKEEYSRLLKENVLDKQYYERLSPEFVKKITKLDGKKLENFMKHCKFKRDFVLQANDYDLIVAIQVCFEEFKKSNL